MTTDQLFKLCSTLAMIGWLGLLFSPVWPSRLRDRLPRLIFAISLPAVVAAVYTALIVLHWKGHPGGFDSLPHVMLLFTDRWLVLAGWIHYLAFDLFIGGWELADSRQRDINHLVMIPILLLTFMFGPIGLLTYLTLRLFFRRKSELWSSAAQIA